MTKLFSNSTISRRHRLPAAADVSDGSFCYLSETYVDEFAVTRTPGLYLYSFQRDTNAGSLGDQNGFGWIQISSTNTAGSSFLELTGGSLSGNVSGTSFRAAQGIPLNDTTTVGFGFGADGDSGLFSVGTGDVGTSVSVYLNAVEKLRITSTGITFDGSALLTSASGIAYDSARLNGQNASYYLNLNNMTAGTIELGAQTSGILPAALGGTGFDYASPGGVLYGQGVGIGVTLPGQAGQFLRSNDLGAPSWANIIPLPTPVSNGIVFAQNNSVYNLIPIGTNTQVLTVVGGVPTWQAPSTIGTVAALTTPRNITLTGNATGSITATLPQVGFDGSADVSIQVAVQDSQRVGGFLPSVTAPTNATSVAVRSATGDLEVQRISVNQPATTIGGLGNNYHVFVSRASDGLSERVTRADFLSDVGAPYIPLAGSTAITGILKSSQRFISTHFISAGDANAGNGAVELWAAPVSNATTGAIAFKSSDGRLQASMESSVAASGTLQGTLFFNAAQHTFYGGNISADFNRIEKVATPVKTTDAVNKAYVSEAIAGSSNSLYQQGSWTPVLNFGGVPGVGTYTQRDGRWFRIGNVGWIVGYIQIGTLTGATGVASITGCPLASVGYFPGTASINNAVGLTGPVNPGIFDVTSIISLRQWDSTGDGSQTTDANYVVGTIVEVCITFQTSGLTPPVQNFVNFSVSETTGNTLMTTFAFTSLATGDIISHTYDFGDGTISTSANPTKIYAADGTYTVVYTVVFGNGSTLVETKTNLITTTTYVGGGGGGGGGIDQNLMN